MTLGEWIQFSIAVIAAVAAILSYFNIRATNKQIQQQKKEWEYTNKPIFKITYYEDFNHSIIIVIRNENDVFHKISEVNYSDSEINTTLSHYGYIVVTDSKTKEKTVHEGMTVTLYPKSNEEYAGTISIAGTDLIGKNFQAISKEIIIKNKCIENGYEIRNSYFEFL